MKIEYGSDADYIVKKNWCSTGVESWTKELFEKENSGEFGVPKEAFDWFLGTAINAFNRAENDRSRRMILIKIIHTREVMRAGFDIANGESGTDWNMHQVGAVCLLHDIARFDQALLGSFSDYKTNFDHGLIGAKMIKDHTFADFRESGIDKASVIEAVKNHNRVSYRGNDRYAKLTRDADKLALLRTMPELMEIEEWHFARQGVTEGALRSYMEKKLVLHRDMKTKADLFLAWLAWENDFNFEVTKKSFIDEGIRDWMVEELKLLEVKL